MRMRVLPDAAERRARARVRANHPRRGVFDSKERARGARLVPRGALKVLDKRLVNPALPQVPAFDSNTSSETPCSRNEIEHRERSVRLFVFERWSAHVERVQDLRVQLVKTRAAVHPVRVNVLHVVCSISI